MYYKDNLFYEFEIIMINKLLTEKIESIKQNNVKIYIIIASLSLPIWNKFIEVVFLKWGFIEMIKITFPLILLISSFLIIFYHIFTVINNTFKNEILITTNLNIIKNIVNLNLYILNDKVYLSTNKKRKKRKY